MKESAELAECFNPTKVAEGRIRVVLAVRACVQPCVLQVVPLCVHSSLHVCTALLAAALCGAALLWPHHPQQQGRSAPDTRLPAARAAGAAATSAGVASAEERQLC